MSEYFKRPAEVLHELGIQSPEDLDIEAIAFHCGAVVRYRQLEGCAARITGRGNRAIITVDEHSPEPRRRFSVGHELGHWMYDRGKLSFSCEENLLVNQWTKDNPESRANRYAADLLLPKAIFQPHSREFASIDFRAVKTLAKLFRTSLTATAIRLVECGPLPAMLVCYSRSGREWFVRGPDVPSVLWPKNSPDAYSYAADLFNSTDDEAQGDVAADAWFDHDKADRYSIHEHSIRAYDGLILSLLWWRDERMLIKIDEDEERRAYRRSDRR